MPHHTCSHLQVEDSPVGTIFRGNLRADAGAPSHRTAKRSPLPSRHTSAETAIDRCTCPPSRARREARSDARYPPPQMWSSRGCRRSSPTHRGAHRPRASQGCSCCSSRTRCPSLWRSSRVRCTIRTVRARASPALCLVSPLGLVGRGRRSKAVCRHSCHCDPVRRSGRREGAGVSGARPEGGKDAAVGRGLGSGPLLSLGVLVHRPWLRPLLLQYATPPLPSASRRTPHKLQ